MTLEDKLRNALRETAGEIPDDPPPPLRLSPLAVSRQPARRRPAKPHGPRWPSWAAPLAAAAAIVALVVASLTLAHDRPNVEGPSNSQATTTSPGLAGIPPYYVALTVPGTHPDPANGSATAAEVRATATGAVLARIAVPRPYVHFSGVTAAADDRTFILVAEEKNNPPEQAQAYYPASRFFLLRITPGAPVGRRVSLRALPAGFIPANSEVRDLALSPDGTSLAADIISGVGGSQLYVFDLAAGTRRSWSFKTCQQCSPSSGGLGFGGLNVDALSWTADGRHLAFVGPFTATGAAGPGASSYAPAPVRLLDVRAPGTNLLASSKIVLRWPSGASKRLGPTWRGVVITPDGRSVVLLEQLVTYGPTGKIEKVRELLAKASVATGKVTAVYRNLKPVGQFQQVMYTNATGRALVVYYFGLGSGTHVGILRGNQFTPIPWNPHTVTAAW
ncbi:MAG TPA: hypothetical protein VFV73_40490 [Streptosporangiaceae bacterium]|nr:hypothetical protein [Streptosporangiaceae bacterium]